MVSFNFSKAVLCLFFMDLLSVEAQYAPSGGREQVVAVIIFIDAFAPGMPCIPICFYIYLPLVAKYGKIQLVKIFLKSLFPIAFQRRFWLILSNATTGLPTCSHEIDH